MDKGRSKDMAYADCLLIVFWKAHAFVAYHMKLGLEAQTSWESGRRKSATSKLNSAKTNCVIQ